MKGATRHCAVDSGSLRFSDNLVWEDPMYNTLKHAERASTLMTQRKALKLRDSLFMWMMSTRVI
jgi:hypothetical protein